MAFASTSNKKHFCDNDLVIVLILNFDLPEQNVKSQPEANSKIQTKSTTDKKFWFSSVERPTSIFEFRVSYGYKNGFIRLLSMTVTVWTYLRKFIKNT